MVPISDSYNIIARRNLGDNLQPSHFTDGEIKAQRSGQEFALQSSQVFYLHGPQFPHL